MTKRISLRPASLYDDHLLLTWRNDQSARNNSREDREIPYEEHRKWLEVFLGNPDNSIFIGNLGGSNTGYVRFDSKDAYIEVSIMVDPGQRKRGIGAEMLQLAMDQIDKTKTLVATIKKTNAASIRLFGSCGFHVIREDARFVTLHKGGIDEEN